MARVIFTPASVVFCDTAKRRFCDTSSARADLPAIPAATQPCNSASFRASAGSRFSSILADSETARRPPRSRISAAAVARARARPAEFAGAWAGVAPDRLPMRPRRRSRATPAALGWCLSSDAPPVRSNDRGGSARAIPAARGLYLASDRLAVRPTRASPLHPLPGSSGCAPTSSADAAACSRRWTAEPWPRAASLSRNEKSEPAAWSAGEAWKASNRSYRTLAFRAMSCCSSDDPMLPPM